MFKVSVIIPVFNTERYLEECLNSVYAQSLQDIQIVCVDDGSTDRSPEILEAFTKRTVGTVMIRQENKGAAAARNRGLQEAEGEFVFFLDSDDRIASAGALERLYAAAIKYRTDIAGGSLCRDVNGRLFTEFRGSQKKYVFHREGRQTYKDYQYDLGFFRFIYRRSFLNLHGICFPSYRNFEDPVFMVRAFQAAGTFAAVPDLVYIYRDVSGSSSHRMSLENLLDMTAAMEVNMTFAWEHGLTDLYRLTYRHLNRESRSELEYALNELDRDGRLYKRLIHINGNIHWDILSEKEEGLLEPLQMVYREYRQYEKLRKQPAVRILRPVIKKLQIIGKHG